MVSFEEVRAAVSPDEPDYKSAALLGPDALPHLDRMIFGEDMALATKATSLVGLIRDPRSAPILRRAVAHEWPTVRVAAAAIAPQLDAGDAADVLTPLLQDPDPGIRKVALRSSAYARSESLRAALSIVAKSDPVPELRQLAQELESAR
jgi:HEAT repeat protein